MYVLLYKEEQELKSEKWEPITLWRKLVGFGGHTIYHVYLEEQSKVIKIKDLQIYEDHVSKDSTHLPTYKENPTFHGFLADDNNNKVFRDPIPMLAPPPAALSLLLPSTTTSQAGCTVKTIAKVKEYSSKKISPPIIGTEETHVFITKLIQLLKEKKS